MAETKSLGQIAYEAYFAKCQGKSLLTNEPLPTWMAQLPVVREAWEAAAESVLNISQRTPEVVTKTDQPQTPENKSPNEPYPGQTRNPAYGPVKLK